MKVRGRDTSKEEASESKSYEAKEQQGSFPCAYPETNRVPPIEDIEDLMGFKDNSAHAIHSASKTKNKGISPTHNR